jgi:ABC-type antimicrobial peptide transport system permease subunit
MLALGAGAQAQVTAQFEALGTNLLVVRPAQRGTGGVISGTQQNLSVEDAAALSHLPDVESVSPVVSTNSQVKYMNRNTPTQILGVAVTYFSIQNFDVEKGRAFTETEGESMAKVAVLGSNAATKLFDTGPAVGETIKVKGINFLVVGVLKSKGDQAGFNADDQIMVPYSTAMKILLGVDYLREIDVLVAQGGDINAVSGQPPDTGFGGGRGGGRGGFGGGGGTIHHDPPPPDSVTALLRKRHKLADLSVADDFMIQNRADILARVSASIMTFRFLLGGIAAISLLVGGIGIMNIMLVTVTERTREIGTRKAIGAKNRDVLLQFLVESVVMSGLGGALGAFSGVGLAWLLPHIPKLESFPHPVVQLWVVIMSIAVAAGVGIFFGLYPAYRASLLDPIDALRYE